MAVLEAPVEVESVSGENGQAVEAPPEIGAGGKNEKKQRTLNGVYVQTPPALREKLEGEATAANKSVALYVRDLLASRFEIVLEPPKRRAKYATDDERKNAITKRRQEKASLMKLALEAYMARVAGDEAKQAELNAQLEATLKGEVGDASATNGSTAVEGGEGEGAQEAA